MKKILFLFVLICNALILNTQDTKQIDDYLNVLEDNDKLMATMTVTKKGNQFYSKAVGFADVANNIKNTN